MAGYNADAQARSAEAMGTARNLTAEGAELESAAMPGYEAAVKNIEDPAYVSSQGVQATADVASAYQGAKAANERALAAQGVNPGDPAAVAGSNATAVNLAAQEAGASNVAQRAARQQQLVVGSGAVGQGTGLQATGANIENTSAGVSEGLGGQQASLLNSQQQQNTSLIPSFSIKKGGKVPRKGFRPSTMRTPEGQVLPTSAGPARGHIDGPGTGTSDDVDAKLSAGEYVLTAKATKAVGPETLDRLTELGHRAHTDPQAAQQLKDVVRRVHAGGFRAPTRIAGQEPRMSRAPSGALGRSVGADDGGFTPGQQKFADSMREKPSTYKGPTLKDVGDFASDVGSGISKAASATGDFLKKHVTSQGAISDIRASSPMLSSRGSAAGGYAGGGFRPDKVKTVMHEFKHGQLHSGSSNGPVVKKRKQAVAIAMSESGQAKPKAKHGGFRIHVDDGGVTIEPHRPHVRADDGGYLDSTDINAVPNTTSGPWWNRTTTTGGNAEQSIVGAQNQEALKAANSPPPPPQPAPVTINDYGSNRTAQGGRNNISLKDIVALAAKAG